MQLSRGRWGTTINYKLIKQTFGRLDEYMCFFIFALKDIMTQALQGTTWHNCTHFDLFNFTDVNMKNVNVATANAGTQSVLSDTFFWQRWRTPNIFLLPVLLWEYLPCCKKGFQSSCSFKDFFKKPSCANKRKYSHWHRRRMCTFKQTMKSFIAFFFIWKSNWHKTLEKCVFQRKGTWKRNTSVTYRERKC